MQLLSVLNALKELIYISDVETYEILFANTALKQYFNINSYEGMKCHSLLLHSDTPCDFCTIPILKEDEVYTWDFYNPLISKQGKLKDMLVQFNGRKAKLQIIEDQTEDQKKNEELSRALNMERITINCVKNLYKSSTPEDSIHFILQQIGDLLKADRAYIFQIQGNVMNNTYEWCADGVVSQLDFCQNMDVALINIWKDYFNEKKSAVFPDITTMREEHPESYEALAAQDIKSIVASPLFIYHKLDGYIGVDNPKPDELEHLTIIDTLSHFLGISLEQMRMNEALIHTSYTDSLTGLSNRNRFSEDIEVFSKQTGVSMGIVYMDLNGLKDLNDTYGHRYGDQILQEGADMLRDVFTDSHIYRVGGDEFVVLSENITEDTLKLKVIELQKHFLLSTDCKGAVGSVWTDNCSTLPKHISDADGSMYQDKMKYYHTTPTSKRYRYYNDDTLMLAEKDTLLAALDEGQFEVFLQPKVTFENRAVLGAEALIRYRDKKGELMGPDLFVPSMEEARTIFYIDLYVLETMCRLIRDWHLEGLSVAPISVNCSRYTLMLPDFIQRLNQIWGKYKIPKHLIEIEVVESAENLNHNAIISIMAQIKNAGFPVCIDDFGNKSSNMALFVNSSLDILKLDKSMISEITTNEKSQMLIRSFAQICHDINLQLIVEGVETEEQFTTLRGLGCDGLQGYLISHPIPIAEYKKRFVLDKV